MPTRRHPRSVPPGRAIVAVAFLLLAGLAGCSSQEADPPVARTTFLTVRSFDGHAVPITVYRPEADGAVPVVLHSHGWGGARETRLEAFRGFTDAGLAVVSIDMRGHGEARGTSQARVADPSFEGRDVRAVLDHLAAQDWVLQEGGDPVVGAMGESYGGAFGLLAGASDGRLDAIVAQDTWHDLAAAMAPNGVPKTAWFASLWLSAAAQGSIHPQVRQGFEAAIRQDGIPAGNATADLRAAFAASSPATHPVTARAPTLLLQGSNDTLFDLGQALRNMERLQDAGVEVALVTHLAGHAFGTRPATGLPRHPCGDPDALALAWMRRHLRGDDVEVPRACIALGTGGVRTADAFPLPGTQAVARAAGALEVRAGDASSRAVSSALGLAGDAVGIPRLRGTMSATTGNGTVYWSLAGPGGTPANGQVAPLRFGPGPERAFELELAAVAVPAEGLALMVAGHADLFASHAAGPAVRFTGLEVVVPVAPGG